MKKNVNRPQGFTLVELLVVIGIIAILLSILMPTMGRAKRQAQRTQCLSNLRQLATAAQNYAANNKQAYPLHLAWNDPSTSYNDISVPNPLNGITNNSPYQTNWLGALWKYLGKEARAMQCPSAPEATEITGMTNNFEQAIRTYAYNGVVGHYSGRKIKRASEVCTFKDDGSKNATTGATVRPHWGKGGEPVDGELGWSGWMWFADPNDSNAGPSGRLTDKYHNDGQCLAFLDGHAEWRHWKDITCKTFGLEPNPGARGVVEVYEARVAGYNNSARWFRRATK